MRRVATVLVTSALTVGGMAAIAPSASADTAPEALTITVTNLGPEQRTCHIDADLYVPSGVDSAHRAPAVLTTNGFGGSKTDQGPLARSLVRNGYVVLAYTGLGFVDGDQCPITLDDRAHDGAAASQLLRFLGGDPTITAVEKGTTTPVVVDQVETQTTTLPYDPVVGMVGLSYGGEIQFATAAYEKETYGATRLDAINPQITWNDLSYSLDPNNQLPDTTAANGSVSSNDPGVFKFEWSLFFTGEGVADGAQDTTAITTPAQAQAYVDQLLNRQNCANFAPQVCTALTEVATQGYPSQASIAFLRNASVASYIKDVTVPTMLWQGEADSLFNLQESVATYTTLARQKTPVALQWQSWGHSHMTPASGEYDQSNLGGTYEGQELLAWFGHWLKGDASTPQSGFRYYQDWNNTYAGAASPTKAAALTTYFLSGSAGANATTPTPTPTSPSTSTSTGGGGLVTRRGAVQPGTSSWSSTGPFGPNYSETSAAESSLPVEPPPTDPAGSSVRFLTAPFTRATDVVGSSRLTVQLSSSTVPSTQAALGAGGQLVVYAKIYDVDTTTGNAVELPHRLISPTRVGDITKPVTIELPGIVHRFAAGHELAIVLAGGDLAYRGSTTAQPVTLTIVPGKAPTLLVPYAA